MEESKETDKDLNESNEDQINESESEGGLLGFSDFKFINDYSPFKFNERRTDKKFGKYFAFKYCQDDNINHLKTKKRETNEDSEPETKINKVGSNSKISAKQEKYEINKNNPNNVPNLGPTFNDLIEIDESSNEVDGEVEVNGEVDVELESEENEEDDFFSCFNDFVPREDNSAKLISVDIIDTYCKIKPSYRATLTFLNKEEEEGVKPILTKPSEAIYNNGNDNIEYDLIVKKEDEIKNEEKNVIYIVKELLGTGISGQTFKAFCINDQKEYALKIIKSKDVYTIVCEKEYQIMKELNEKDKNDQYHIIRSYDHFIFKNHLCIVNELMQQTLLDILNSNNTQGITLTSIRFIAIQILNAVDFIHSLNIVHTDLKPENILLSLRKENNSNNNLAKEVSQSTDMIRNKVLVKIADFGSACKKDELKNKTYIQSMYYRAPEVIIEYLLNEKVDVWSIGCILVELYLSTPLIPGTSSFDQLYKIHTLIGEIPQYLIYDCKKLNQYFKRDDVTSYFRIKTPKEYYKEHPKAIPKEFYQIPESMKNLDDLINVKKEPIKSRNSLYKSLNNSSISVNSSTVKDDIVKFIHLIKVMLQIDPNKRWSCKKCLSHPFITKEKLSKAIKMELNDANQFYHNSINYNDKSQNHYYGSQINNSINFNNYTYNIAKYFNQNNYSFGNDNNNNNLNFMNLYQNQLGNNNIPMNAYNNQFQNKNNYSYNYNNNNKKLNSSFSYNQNYQNIFYQNQVFPQYFIPNQNINFQNYNNMNINNYNNVYNNSNKNMRCNNTFIGTYHQNLNSSYNNYNNNINVNQNNKSNRQKSSSKQKFHKNKKYQPNEFKFNKNHILNNLDENYKKNLKKDNFNINNNNEQINQEKFYKNHPRYSNENQNNTSEEEKNEK